MPFKTWDDTGRELALALDGLWDQEFVILGETSPPARRRRLFARRHPAPTRFVQAVRIDDVYFAECVGAASLGGTWEMQPETIVQMKHLGWLTPAESLEAYGNVTPNFEQYADRGDLRPLAEVLVTSLRLLGASPTDLELQVSGGPVALARS
jgi:hypothetical protein